MSDCKAEFLESSDPDRSRWWCPKCGPNITGPCDDEITTLTAKLAKAMEALRKTEAKLTVWARVPPGHMGVHFVRVRIEALTALRDTARRALSELEDK